ncbi:hypothetical protein LKL81_26100 [Bacillus paranthracis]|uniref:hypothetical protein n=1 Tax=Bacillus paranthracis TaxID=2026186 RepID=UPI001E61CF0D|nr:hypothetical protein [Bacillus paranthracis]MCC2430687.1 hypothetical protein [Bacillus paranthracis]
MEKQLQVKENTLNDEIEQTCRQFIHFGLDKGLSAKESCALLEELMDLVEEGRGDEWTAIAQDAIHKANNK